VSKKNKVAPESSTPKENSYADKDIAPAIIPSGRKKTAIDQAKHDYLAFHYQVNLGHKLGAKFMQDHFTVVDVPKETDPHD